MSREFLPAWKAFQSTITRTKMTIHQKIVLSVPFKSWVPLIGPAVRRAEAVRAGEHPIPIDTIANVHRACFAAVESLRTGRSVAL